jgi:hypothetical protein
VSPHRGIITVLAQVSLRVCRRTSCCCRDFLTAIRALAVRQTLTFAGVPDPLALVPPPPEFPEQPGVLQLPLQSTQGKLYIIVMHRDS